MLTQCTLFRLYAILFEKSIFTLAAVLQGVVCGMDERSTHRRRTVIKSHGLCNSAGQIMVTQARPQPLCCASDPTNFSCTFAPFVSEAFHLFLKANSFLK
jgi:hypothetical protein